jgi:hypothetical protein
MVARTSGKEVARLGPQFDLVEIRSLWPWAERLSQVAPVGHSGWECLLED